MNASDLTNALFELGASAAIWISIFKVWEDKFVAGISWLTILFFTTWGFWNLYYYYDLEQYLSWYAGMAMAVTNVVYLYSLIKFRDGTPR